MERGERQKESETAWRRDRVVNAKLSEDYCAAGTHTEVSLTSTSLWQEAHQVPVHLNLRLQKRQVCSDHCEEDINYPVCTRREGGKGEGETV